MQNKNGETPLHIASRYGCTEIVKFLCEYGANLDVQDDVSFCASFSQFYCLKRFIQLSYLKTNLIFNKQQLETALHVASWHGFPEIVKYFCHFGCDVNLRNKVSLFYFLISPLLKKKNN